MFKAKRGQAGGIVGLIVAIILIVGVSIPVTIQVVDTANLTGLTATIVSFIPVFLAIAGLVVVSKVM
jgi:protein-S-isoprenylcysteine O-methyltransferase Ste14